MKILNHPLFVVSIILLMAFEYFYSRKKGLNNYSPYETFSNLFLIGVDKILGLITGTDGGALAQGLWSLRLFEVNSLALTFVAVEFMYYCNHWYHHHVNIGWATHIMHHSPTKFNFSLGYRLGITRLFSLGWLVFLPLIILGFHPDQVALCLAVIFMYQFFIHTELVPSLGFLDKIINTPSNHRVHHSAEPRYYNKNLGGITVVFDHLFGTYQKDDLGAQMQYGIASIMNKKNLWHEIIFQWSEVFNQFKKSSGVKAKFKALFGSPT